VNEGVVIIKSLKEEEGGKELSHLLLLHCFKDFKTFFIERENDNFSASCFAHV
jgi:hypothetical protein